MKWRPSSGVTLPSAGFIEPCIPTRVMQAPKSADWIYELKMDGYRLMVRRLDDKVRIYSRRGADFTPRFPRIVDAVRRLKVKSVLRDGEGIVYDQHGMPSFDLIHSKQYDREVSLVAFDLLELDGADIRKRPLLDRKALLAKPRFGTGSNSASTSRATARTSTRLPASWATRALSRSGKTCPTNLAGRSVG